MKEPSSSGYRWLVISAPVVGFLAGWQFSRFDSSGQAVAFAIRVSASLLMALIFASGAFEIRRSANPYVKVGVGVVLGFAAVCAAIDAAYSLF